MTVTEAQTGRSSGAPADQPPVRMPDPIAREHRAMLQRQQAGAVVAPRERIVEGAVGMVEMVNNLLVVLCGDRATQPVVNAGSLYH